MKNIILLAIVALGALSMTACKTTKSCGTCPTSACSK
jgi:predicted small secreted protein